MVTKDSSPMSWQDINLSNRNWVSQLQRRLSGVWHSGLGSFRAPNCYSGKASRQLLLFRGMSRSPVTFLSNFTPFIFALLLGYYKQNSAKYFPLDQKEEFSGGITPQPCGRNWCSEKEDDKLTAEQLGKGRRRWRQTRKKPLNISKHGSALQEDLMQQCGVFTSPSVVPGWIFSPCKQKEGLAATKS